jgi:hypothetical protein
VILIVKSSFALPASLLTPLPTPCALLTSLALITALSGCGQTGPLYMPNQHVGHGVHHSAGAAPAPVPASAPIQLSPPSPAAGVTTPVANSNANNTEATNQSPPSTQQ